MTLYIGDKPYLFPDAAFKGWYEAARESFMNLSLRAETKKEINEALWNVAFLDEYAALREYVKRDNKDFPYGST